MSQKHAAVLEPEPAPPPTRYPRHLRRWILGIGLSLLALGGIGLLLLARHWPFSQEEVTQSLEEQFHGKVTFTSFRKTFFPHPGCVAEGAVLVRASKLPNTPPFATAQKFTLRAHYLDLLFRPGFIAHIDLQALHIQVPVRGSTIPMPRDETPSNTRVGEVVANNAVLEVARQSRKPLRFEIHTLTLGSVSRKDAMSYDATFLNALPPGEIQSRGHFGPWNSDDPGQTRVSGTYKFEHAYLGVFAGVDGVLTSHDDFQGTLAEIETRGTVEIPDFKVRRAGRSSQIQSRYHAFVNALNGDVRLEHVETSIGKTEVLAHGSISEAHGPRGKITTLDINVSNGRIQDVLRLFIKETRSPIGGITSFRARVTIPPEGRPFEQEVILTGDFGIGGGHFTKPETQKKVEDLSERARGKKPEPDDEEDASRLVSDLDGHVELKNSIATLTNISFRIPGAVAHMHGTFNLLNEKIDFHGVLKTDAEFSKVSGGGFKSIFLKPFDAFFKKKPNGSEIPVKMTGTYAHPQPGLEITGGKKKEESKKEKQ